MRKIFAIIALIMAINCNAAPFAADSAAADTSAVTVASDSVIDDTANYTISTTIPKSLTQAMEDMIDGSEEGGDSGLPKLIKFVFGLTGLGIGLTVIFFFLIPIILIAVIIWLVLKSRNNAKRADLRYQQYRQPFNVSPETPDLQDARQEGERQTPPAAPAYKNANSVKQNYSHRRDNAITTSCIGAGIIAFSAILDFDFGIAAGVVVLFIGIGDYLVYRSHLHD